VFVYGVTSYAIFFTTFLALFAFVGNVVLPRTIDGEATLPFGVAAAIDGALILLFGLQHSVMARPGFKRWLTRFIPEPAERATYVLASSVALIALMAFWQPLGGTVWDVRDPIARTALFGLFVCGWLIVLVTTFVINHFDLFGLRQVWIYLRGREYTHLKFRTPGPYKYVRHPLYVGWLTAFWATPTMTAAHLVFALGLMVYILIAIYFEERDLIAHFGERYRTYRQQVPMFIPLPGRKSVTPSGANT
jgi:protein-S-isoprenylcysteine O-methyltransferase Ste14